jgi:hypothetical protein
MAAGEIKKPGRTRKSPGFKGFVNPRRAAPDTGGSRMGRNNIMDEFPPIWKPFEYSRSTRAALSVCKKISVATKAFLA